MFLTKSFNTLMKTLSPKRRRRDAREYPIKVYAKKCLEIMIENQTEKGKRKRGYHMLSITFNAAQSCLSSLQYSIEPCQNIHMFEGWILYIYYLIHYVRDDQKRAIMAYEYLKKIRRHL